MTSIFAQGYGICLEKIEALQYPEHQVCLVYQDQLAPTLPQPLRKYSLEHHPGLTN